MTGTRIARAAKRMLYAAGCALVLFAHPSNASEWVPLAPYKDKLFDYAGILDGNADRSFMVVDYSETRDVDRRDSVPAMRVRRSYVDLSVRRAETRRTIEADGRRIAVDETGRGPNARFAVIFVHGRGGDRRLGSDDWSFGGNFNRIKNLAVRNGGLYIAPSVVSFDGDGADDIAALVDHVAGEAPGAKIVLACASMGSFICWRLADREATVRHLSGMIVMGGIDDPRYPATPAFAASLPLLMTHGSDDPVYSWQRQKQVFDRIRKSKPAYPVRFVLFNSGIHGTPIRMTDWRTALNWIFATSGTE